MMCGIGGVFTREPLPSIAAVALAMAQRQRHRGPDHQAVYAAPDGCVALSHARLSIVDLSPQGNQPMTNAARNLWLVCNGEIYNYQALRRQLEAHGHRFCSHSDSEVILHLYEDHGLDMLQYLHGMFAFALYDATARRLLCARDRVGKKPLVYAQTPHGVAFASEIPAVCCFPGIPTTVDPMAFGLYLLRNVRHIPDPWTFYKGIRRLLPGHAMLVEGGTIRRLWRYWCPDFAVRETSPSAVLEAFDRAVALRRVADVEVGALLSGGVDSSGIVQAMVAQGSRGVRTYAMGRDKDDEELVRARRMARLLGTVHQEFYFEPERHHAHLETLLRLHGEPIMLLPLLYTYELCQHIRDDGIRVVMAGHGADELFYGYSGHNHLALLSTLLPFVPRCLRPWLGKLALRCAPGSKLRDALLVAATPAGIRKARLYRDEAKRLWAALLHLPDLERSVEEAIGEWLETWVAKAAPKDYIDEASIISLMHENSHSVTIAGDLPAMAASVEVRCPFLDQELVQLAWRIPYWQKVRGIWDRGQNKRILKQALAGRVPHDVLYAAKRGFGYYIREEEVLRGAWKAKVDAVFADMNDFGGLLNVKAVQTLKHTFDQGAGVPAMLMAKLYAAVLLDKQKVLNNSDKDTNLPDDVP